MLSVTQVLKNLIKGNLETVFLISLPKIKVIYKIHSSNYNQIQMIFPEFKTDYGEKKKVKYM